MRISILFFFIIIFNTISFSQNIVSEGNQWNILERWWGSYHTDIYKIEGDTFYNSKNYKIIWHTSDTVSANWTIWRFIREDSNKVYMAGYNEEFLLYDFNIGINDTVIINNEVCIDLPLYCSSIDTVEYFGISRKRYKMDYQWGMNDDEYWIEGIGSNEGLFYSHHEDCITDVNWELLCFYSNDTILYKNPYYQCYETSVGIQETSNDQKIVITPNPILQGQTIKINSNKIIRSINILDINGRLRKKQIDINNKECSLQTDKLNSGIYFLLIGLENNQKAVRKLIIN